MTPPLGVITGSGTYALPGIEDAFEQLVATQFGTVELTTGRLAGFDVIHASRHGDGHPRLSHQVNHRGNVAALRELGASCVIGLATCGGVDPSVHPGDLILFDDLHFPSNRLPDGSLCTLHAEPGEPARAHWMFEFPFAERLREALGRAIAASERPHRLEGCYGHVDGPRFNSRSEVRALRGFGVTAIGQTAGPETVLCGEAGIPYALLGCVTGHATGTVSASTRMEVMMSNIGSTAEAIGALLPRLVAAAAFSAATPPGVNHGFETRPDLYSVAASSNGAA